MEATSRACADAPAWCGRHQGSIDSVGLVLDLSLIRSSSGSTTEEPGPSCDE